MENLTKKNQEFIHIAKNQLHKDGKSTEEIQAIIDDIMPSILEQQNKGIPARTFLGAPTAWAATFTQQETTTQSTTEPKNTKPLFMWTDSALFFLGLVSLIQGFLALTNSNQIPYGIFTLLATGLAGGGVMYLTYHFFYRHLGKERSQRPNFWKNLGLLTLSFAGWVLLVSLVSLLPTQFNPQLPALLMVVLGAAAFAGRYFFKKHFNVQSSFTVER